MSDDHIHDQAERKADHQSAQVDEQIKDTLSDSGEVERILADNASDIARVYCLNEGKATCADLVLQQIQVCIEEDAQHSVNERNH